MPAPIHNTRSFAVGVTSALFIATIYVASVTGVPRNGYASPALAAQDTCPNGGDWTKYDNWENSQKNQSHDAGSGKTVVQICVKGGNDVIYFDANGTKNCWVASGIGSQIASIAEDWPGDSKGSDCKDISHASFRVSTATPTPTTQPNPGKHLVLGYNVNCVDPKMEVTVDAKENESNRQDVEVTIKYLGAQSIGKTNSNGRYTAWLDKLGNGSIKVTASGYGEASLEARMPENCPAGIGGQVLGTATDGQQLAGQQSSTRSGQVLGTFAATGTGLPVVEMTYAVGSLLILLSGGLRVRRR